MIIFVKINLSLKSYFFPNSKIKQNIENYSISPKLSSHIRSPSFLALTINFSNFCYSVQLKILCPSSHLISHRIAAERHNTDKSRQLYSIRERYRSQRLIKVEAHSLESLFLGDVPRNFGKMPMLVFAVSQGAFTGYCVVVPVAIGDEDGANIHQGQLFFIEPRFVYALPDNLFLVELQEVWLQQEGSCFCPFCSFSALHNNFIQAVGRKKCDDRKERDSRAVDTINSFAGTKLFRMN